MYTDVAVSKSIGALGICASSAAGNVSQSVSQCRRAACVQHVVLLPIQPLVLSRLAAPDTAWRRLAAVWCRASEGHCWGFPLLGHWCVDACPQRCLDSEWHAPATGNAASWWVNRSAHVGNCQCFRDVSSVYRARVNKRTIPREKFHISGIVKDFSTSFAALAEEDSGHILYDSRDNILFDSEIITIRT